MQNPFFCGDGGVVSADMAVPDHEREVRFYRSVLSTGDSPMWREDLMNNLGQPIIGVGERIPEYEHLPLQWMPHFQVADIAASVAAAIELGAQELLHSKSDDGQSQWAGLTDPEGAGFGLIPVVDSNDYTSNHIEQTGHIAGLTLYLPDAVAAKNFYQNVIGWNARSDGDDTSQRFKMLAGNGNIAAEICRCDGAYNEIPPAWLIHLPVNDFAESIRQVVEHGGEVIMQNSEHQLAVIRDPVGVYVALSGAASSF